MMLSEKSKQYNYGDKTEHLLYLLKVCMDDSIMIVQAKSSEDLRYVSRALLHSIESIFPYGISISKLRKEGKWENITNTINNKTS